MAGENHAIALSELSRRDAIEAFRNRPADETGWSRVKEMFTVRHIKYVDFEFSPELELAGYSFKFSGIAGFLLGFFNQWKPSREIFIRQNKEQKFLGQKDFSSKTVQFQLKYCIRHGARFGIRLGLFTGLYCLGTTTIAMYNNKLTMLEYAASGVVTGALWQAKIGLGGLVMGGTAGGLLSLIAGFGCVKVLESNNEDFASIRYQLHFARLQDWEQMNRIRTEWLVKEMVDEAKQEIGDGKSA